MIAFFCAAFPPCIIISNNRFVPYPELPLTAAHVWSGTSVSRANTGSVPQGVSMVCFVVSAIMVVLQLPKQSIHQIRCFVSAKYVSSESVSVVHT